MLQIFLIVLLGDGDGDSSPLSQSAIATYRYRTPLTTHLNSLWYLERNAHLKPVGTDRCNHGYVIAVKTQEQILESPLISRWA